MNYVPRLEHGKHFIRDYFDLIMDENLQQRLFAEKALRDKIP